MARKRWKKTHPRDMQEAIRLCLDYAVHRHNRSVARVGDLVGVSEWVIYKWMSEGSIPSRRIRPFEFACDATYVTEYLGHSAQKLIVDIPSGGDVSQDDLLNLQTVCNQAVNELTRYYRGEADTPDVLETVTRAMRELAGHRENVIKTDAPELPMFSGEDT
ncbi:MAG: hypothetical protein RJQ08_08600 [Salinisphaeraceae bacterium]